MMCVSDLRKEALQSLYCKFSEVKQANLCVKCHSSQWSCFIAAEQEINGNAIAMVLAYAPGPDWLKDIVPTLSTMFCILSTMPTRSVGC